MSYNQDLRDTASLISAEQQINIEMMFSEQAEQESAEQDCLVYKNQIDTIRHALQTTGVTAPLLTMIGVDEPTLKHFGLSSIDDVDTVSGSQRTYITEQLLRALDMDAEQMLGTEGIREWLHSDKLRGIAAMALSFFYPTDPKKLRMAQKALSGAKGDMAKAVAAAKASGGSERAVAKAVAAAQKAGGLKIAAAEAAVAPLKISFLKSMFRGVVIGSIAQAVIQYGLGIADKIVNAGRVYGTAGEVTNTLNSIKQLLTLLNNAATIKFDPSGSDAEAGTAKLKSLLESAETVYKTAPSYTMTKGKESGWNANNIQSLAKSFDALITQTDSLSDKIVGNAKTTLTLSKNPPSEKVMDGINERNHVTMKITKLTRKLVNQTTSVFDDLQKFVNKKGVGGLEKDSSKTNQQK